MVYTLTILALASSSSLLFELIFFSISEDASHTKSIQLLGSFIGAANDVEVDNESFWCFSTH